MNLSEPEKTERTVSHVNLLLRRVCSVLLGWLFVFSPLWASFTRLSMDDGLSDMIVNSIHRDSAGLVWFGTALGIDRFDGTQIKRYSGENPAHSGAEYGFIHSDKYGLVAGGADGLWRYDPYTDRFVRLPDMPRGIRAMDYSNGRLFIASQHGVYCLLEDRDDLCVL